jgi:hypothetical protein
MTWPLCRLVFAEIVKPGAADAGEAKAASMPPQTTTSDT